MAKVKVTNRKRGTVNYGVPDLHITRTFNPGEYKMIDEEELKALQFVPGGDYILKNYLIVESAETLDTLNIPTEPEYFYNEDDVKRLMMEGSVEEFEDMLNFAPEGLKDIIKTIAVEIELPDMRKRNLIAEKFQFNVTTALEIKNQLEAPAEDVEATAPKRKAATPETPTRKSSTPTPIIIKK